MFYKITLCGGHVGLSWHEVMLCDVMCCIVVSVAAQGGHIPCLPLWRTQSFPPPTEAVQLFHIAQYFDSKELSLANSPSSTNILPYMVLVLTLEDNNLLYGAVVQQKKTMFCFSEPFITETGSGTLVAMHRYPGCHAGLLRFQWPSPVVVQWSGGVASPHHHLHHHHRRFLPC